MTEPHHIRTIADLVDVANEDNVDVLLADLSGWLRLHIALRPLAAKDGVTMASDEFRWYDDGIVGVNRLVLEPRQTPG